ncbi:virulence RhuM family protein [Mediterraneibacter glycyrrhizinilyticus]|uniref:virulence RhuM family protein n=1 Tax=Mediterraneibacter glycyrrhizinilyticus TaxID=342942 RepID=UPI002ED29542
MMEQKELVIFESEDQAVSLKVPIEEETVWLTQAQMTRLFSVDRTVITRHVNNVFRDEELDEKSNVHFLHIANSDKPVKFYSLDVIISVGYRVKSKRGIEFRRWANKVLKDYILKGYAVNHNRISQSLQRKAHFSEMKRMILLKEVSGQFTKHSVGQKSILHWRKKLRICFIF